MFESNVRVILNERKDGLLGAVQNGSVYAVDTCNLGSNLGVLERDVTGNHDCVSLETRLYIAQV